MVTLITGASTGIGAEFARQFAARGHDLVVVARSADKLNDLAAQLRAAHGVDVTVLAMDLSLPTAAGELWQRTNRLGLEIAVLVNNAGFGTHGDVADADPQRLEEAIELNCRTLVGATARYLPQMRARGAGTIINVASTAAFQPLPKMAVYGASKAFVLSFTEALWAEERKHGVRVLAVCPGLTDTPFFEAGRRRRGQLPRHVPRPWDSPALRSRSSTRRCVRCPAANPASSTAPPMPSSRACSPGCCPGGCDRGVRAVGGRLR